MPGQARVIRSAAAILCAGVGTALACPEGQSRGAFGWCYPNIGGEVGKTWEKGKDEAANLEKDVRNWIETGKCGGDLCDALDAALQYGKNQVVDFGVSVEKAGERFEEGKPLDALWHLQTDYWNNSQENAAEAAQKSSVLRATGQIAATVYGGPQGAAAYTAWLTYNATGSFNDAIRAGIISGVSAAALDSVSSLDLDGVHGASVRAILTGAVNGASVAVSGGSEQDVRAAIGMGVVTVMIREGYRKLTDLDLDKHRLKSSTGPAYCLAEVPTADYLAGGAGPSCLAPPSAYTKNADGAPVLDAKGQPKIDFTELDADRPHVGQWATADTSKFNIAAENSAVMTGVSRLPGWNAMAVAHDQLSIKLQFDLLPGGIIPTVATIPPALVATYIGSGNQIHDSIRDTFVKQAQAPQAGRANAEGQVAISPPPTKAATAPPVSATFTTGPTERMHVICGIEADKSGALQYRTDVLVTVAVDAAPLARDGRICDVQQKTGDRWYALAHAHYQLNHCHGVAERIARNRQHRGFSCFASTGLMMTSKPLHQPPGAQVAGLAGK